MIHCNSSKYAIYNQLTNTQACVSIPQRTMDLVSFFFNSSSTCGKIIEKQVFSNFFAWLTSPSSDTVGPRPGKPK